MRPERTRGWLRWARGPAAVVAVILLAGAVAMSQKPVSLAGLVPASIEGWTVEGKDGDWTPQTLHRYIDGGAELYISYGFARAHSRRFLRAGPPQARITVDVFEMGSSADAFGVFAHSREKPQDEVGQGSEYGGGLLHFWKGRYYVSILGQPESPGLHDTVVRLGRQIAAAIPQEGPLPPLVLALPAEGLRRNTIRYFRHAIWLNSHVFISDDNVLNLGPDTGAALGRYALGGRTWILLMADYPTAARAEAARSGFLKAYVPDAGDGIGRGQDGKWAGCRVGGFRLAAVLSAADRASVEQALQRALQPPKRGPSPASF